MENTKGSGKSWKRHGKYALCHEFYLGEAALTSHATGQRHIKLKEMSLKGIVSISEMFRSSSAKQHFLTVLVQALLIPACIRKSCVVYLEKYIVPIGHDFHFFVVENSWKRLFEKAWSPCL